MQQIHRRWWTSHFFIQSVLPCKSEGSHGLTGGLSSSHSDKQPPQKVSHRPHFSSLSYFSQVPSISFSNMNPLAFSSSNFSGSTTNLFVSRETKCVGDYLLRAIVLRAGFEGNCIGTEFVP